MTIKEFAQMLDGTELTLGIGKSTRDMAKEFGFVYVYVCDLGLIDVHGYVEGDFDAYEGVKIYFGDDGILDVDPGCIECNCILFEKYLKKCNVKVVEFLWDHDGYAWAFETDIPHETFDIYEDGEMLCRGIVFEWPFDRK